MLDKAFIGGAWRSGTTWVYAMIGAHPDACGIHQESELFEVVLRPIVWSNDPDRVWATVEAAYDSYCQRRGSSGLFGDRAEFVALVEAARRRDDSDIQRGLWMIDQLIARFVAARAPARLFVEKTPTNMLWAATILDRFPEAGLIEVVRDGRDVVNSSMIRFRDERSAAARMLEWANFIRMGDHLQDIPRFKNRILRVKYEDLVADHRGGVERLLGFCGLEPTPQVVDAIVKATELEAQRERYAWSTRKGMVGDWRNHLAPADLESIELIGGTVLERLGYAR